MTSHSRTRPLAAWLACAAALVLIATAHAGTAHLPEPQLPAWQSLNRGLPDRTSITSLAADPHDERRLFAGAAGEGGVWISDDGGASWTPSGPGLPAEAVLALSPAAVRPGLIYAGLDGAGLFQSEDGGRSWTATGWTRKGTPALLLDPADPRRLFIRVAYERVYESRDGGQTWQARWDGLGLSTQIISLAMDPTRPATLYAGATESFFRSDDGGLHWQGAGPELTGQTVFTIAVDPHDGRNLYVGATNGAYRSVDDGEHWERWGQGLEDITVTAFAFDRHDPRLAFAGTKYRGVFRSQDGGQRWLYAGPEPVSINGLLRSADGRWLYAATTAGFYGTEVRP